MDLNRLFVVKTEPYSVAQAGLKLLTIFLTQSPQCYRHARFCLVMVVLRGRLSCAPA